MTNSNVKLRVRPAALFRLVQLAKLNLQVIDDFAISPKSAPERNDLPEVLDDRVGTATLTTAMDDSDCHGRLLRSNAKVTQ